MNELIFKMLDKNSSLGYAALSTYRLKKKELIKFFREYVEYYIESKIIVNSSPVYNIKSIYVYSFYQVIFHMSNNLIEENHGILLKPGYMYPVVFSIQNKKYYFRDPNDKQINKLVNKLINYVKNFIYHTALDLYRCFVNYIKS